MSRLRHRVGSSGVTVSILDNQKVIASTVVPDGEARRFAWAVLADFDEADPPPQARGKFRPIRTETDAEHDFRRRLNLRPSEAAIVRAMYAGARTRRAIIQAAYAGLEPPCDKALDVFICHIRKKLGEGMVETDPAYGYRLTDAARARIAAALGGFQ